MNPIHAKRIAFSLFIPLIIFHLACSNAPDFVQDTSGVLSVFPSPSDVDVQVITRNSQSQTGTLDIFDPKGDMIFSVNVPTGEHIEHVNISQSPSGKFHAVFKAGSLSVTKTFFK